MCLAQGHNPLTPVGNPLTPVGIEPRTSRLSGHNIKIDLNIQGQITPQSSSPGSNLAQIRTHPRCYGYPCFFPRMKKILSKLTALEWTQYKILIFQTLKGS